MHVNTHAVGDDSERLAIALIGCGPRGLTILERLCVLMPENRSAIIHIIDPNQAFGAGVHPSRQPSHLWVNTVAEQITMFADASVDSSLFGPITKGPTLFEWCEANQYCFDEFKSEISQGVGNIITRDTYVPRSLLGKYLEWCYEEIVANKRSNIEIVEHHCRASFVNEVDNGQYEIVLPRERLTLNNIDLIYLATGHTSNFPTNEEMAMDAHVKELRDCGMNCRAMFVPKPYPLHQLKDIDTESVVAIEGFGLTAHDVVAELTLGRSGYYVQNQDKNSSLKYIPSGKEPKSIIMFSHSGLPYSGRAVNKKALNHQVEPSFLTVERIEFLKRQALETRSSSQLIFDQEIEPLIKREMEFVYFHTLLQMEQRFEDASRLSDSVEKCQIATTIQADKGKEFDACVYDFDELLDHIKQYFLQTNDDPFARIMKPLQGLKFMTKEEYSDFLIDYLSKDNVDALEGNIENPRKAATDVLRDIRDNLRSCIDFGGLTPRSWDQFKKWVSIMNREAVGPPFLRNQQLMALIEAGLVEIAVGPNPVLKPSRSGFSLMSTFFGDRSDQIDEEDPDYAIDVLIQSRIDHFEVSTSSSLLMQHLLSEGLCTSFTAGGHRSPGGLNISSNQCLIDSNGVERKNFFVLGNPVEGPNWYTYVLPRPGVNSRALTDAGKNVRIGLNHVMSNQSESLSPTKD